jgi:diguanylate cyclase (GGDEF)-like protein
VRLTRHVPAALQANLQLEQLKILLQQIPILYTVLLINTAILSFSVYGSVPTVLSVEIPGLFGVLIVARLVVWLMRRSLPPPEAQVARYLASTTLIAAFFSLALGIWGVMLVYAGLGDRPFIPLFITFGSIACAYCLASVPRAAFATIFLATTPVVTSLLASGIKVQAAAGLSLLLISMLILRLITKQYDYFVGTITARSEAMLLAFTDSLTDLANRRAFIECLEKAATSTGVPTLVTLAMIDLDHFKALNDTYGHAVGDAVLLEAARRIKNACTGARIVARLGGDEFAVLFVGESETGLIEGVGATLTRSMAEPFLVCGNCIRLAASVGLSAPLASGQIPMTLMLQADVALYEVKSAGGGSVLAFSPAMHTRLHRRMTIEQALRATNPPPSVQVVYQPICDARSRRITSFEALARWHHPELGGLNPLEFIGVAETTGTISVLSQQIFAAAIEEAAGWNASIGLSINLSAVQLCQPSTPLAIMSLCRRHGFDPRRLEVEVTETSVLADYAIARQQLASLRDAGVRIALDDFGAGFASVSYLKEINFDRIKIDGELVDNIAHSARAARLLHGVLQLCSAVGAEVTAEKVETEQQAAILTGFGCERLQGYLLGRPLQASAVRELIREMQLPA